MIRVKVVMEATAVRLPVANCRKKFLYLSISVIVTIAITTAGILIYNKIKEQYQPTEERTRPAGQSLANGGNGSITTGTPTTGLPIQTTLSIEKGTSVFSEATTLTSTERETTTETVSYPTDFSGFYIETGLNAIHAININESENKTTLVNCVSTDDGLWTVIQRRFSGSVDFYRGWVDYKEGFGDASGEYWLGNEAIHQLTSRSSYRLKVVLKGWDNETANAIYDTFKISNETDSYRLAIGDFHGDAGDSLVQHNGQMFSTLDRDNDESGASCAEFYTGAWWYYSCLYSNLNGHYFDYEADWTVRGRISWLTLREESLKETTMMIQRM